jgi:hypothetical protein
MLAEQRLFVADVTAAGDLSDVLGATHTFANADLAALYGADVQGTVPAGAAFERVELDAHRMGVLTRLAYLTATAGGRRVASPVQRGLALVEAFYCVEMPAPPPDVDTVPPDPDPPMDWREIWEQHAEDPVCAACHGIIDVPGFAFANYDPLGRWIDQIDGFPIDPSGEWQLDPPFPFDDAADLIEIMIADDRVSDCVARRYFEFAVRRRLEERDQCTLDLLAGEFSAAGGNFRALILAIVQTRAFRLARP